MDSNVVDFINKYDPNDEFSYLNTYMSIAMQISMNMNVYQVLENGGIVPG